MHEVTGLLCLLRILCILTFPFFSARTEIHPEEILAAQGTFVDSLPDCKRSGWLVSEIGELSGVSGCGQRELAPASALEQ